MTSDQKRLHPLSSRHVETAFSMPQGFQWLPVSLAVLFVVAALGCAIVSDQYIPHALVLGWVGFLLLSPLVHECQKRMYQARLTLLMLLGSLWFLISEKMTKEACVVAVILGLLLYATSRLEKKHLDKKTSR